jgi:hypothetical protein
MPTAEEECPLEIGSHANSEEATIALYSIVLKAD